MVLVFFEYTWESKIPSSSIRVGTDSYPFNNAECLGGITTHGLFNCTPPLAGNYVGVTRTGQFEHLWIHEIRAYAWMAFDETNSILSASAMPNGTLVNSVHLISGG